MLWYKISTKTSPLTDEFQEFQSKIFIKKQKKKTKFTFDFEFANDLLKRIIQI